MESMESYVPPGFRFHPTDEELVGYYLRKKIASQKIDLDVIRDIDLYRIEPWDLIERCRIGYEEQNEWYFFSHKDKKYPTGTRTNRATMAGFWKATGRDKAVYDKSKLIGMRKTLVFYKGRAPNGQKTDWIMHEYRLESDENGPPQEEGWVVCRAFKKRSTHGGQTKSSTNREAWDTSYFYDEPSGVSSVVDPVDQFMSRKTHHHHRQTSFLSPHNSHSMSCKEENKEADKTSFMNYYYSDQYLQLPQLESPSLPLLKRPISSVSLTSENNKNSNNGNSNNDNNEEEEEERRRGSINVTDDDDDDKSKKVTDWRALDKFVASQLSQEERCEGESSSFEADNNNNIISNNNNDNDNSDMSLLLLLQEW